MKRRIEMPEPFVNEAVSAVDKAFVEEQKKDLLMPIRIPKHLIEAMVTIGFEGSVEEQVALLIQQWVDERTCDFEIEE